MRSKAWQWRSPFLFLSLSLLVSIAARADVAITLDNSFIEAHKNTATISTNFVVEKAHKRPNPPSKDGDMHVAGRAEEVRLPIVAEIMNAAAEGAAVNAVHAAEGTGEAIPMTGAWRIWTEHGGDSIQTQGAPIAPYKNANPDHVFEMHPVTSVNDISVTDSFHPIEGFEAKDADQAFHRYENTRCKITPQESTTTITTTMAGFNYVEFLMIANKDPYPVTGGHMVMASIDNLEGELLVRNRRMVFVEGTEPAAALQNIGVGGCLHVLGIPRLNLSLVSWRAKHAHDRPDALVWSLPYEMIVVGVYPDDACANR